MSIEDELEQKQKEQEKKKAREKKREQAEKQAAAEERAQEIQKLKQQISEYDKRIKKLKSLSARLSAALNGVPKAQQQAVEKAQAEAENEKQLAEEAIQEEFADLQDEYGKEILADAGIDTIQDFRDKLTSKDEEEDLWERLEAAGVSKEQRDSELRYRVAKTNQQLLTEQLADLLNTGTQSPEELIDKSQAEITTLEEKRRELYYQTPEGRQELKNKITEKIRERHDDLSHKYFSDKFQNYQIEEYRRLVDPEDIQDSERLVDYGADGEEFVKDEIVNTYVNQLEEQIENKKDRKNIEWLDVIQELDLWEKGSEKREEFEEKISVLDDEVNRLKEIMQDNGAGEMFEYGFVQNKATRESLDRQVDNIAGKSKKMDRLRRKVERGNFNSTSVDVYNIDYYTQKADDLIEVVRQKQNTVQENPEYWQEVGRIGASRSGSGDTEKFEEGQDKLEFNLEIEDETVTGQLDSDWNSSDSDQVAPRGVDTDKLTPSKINNHSLGTIEDSLKEEKENIEKERKEKEKRIKEKVEYDFAHRKVESADTGKRLQDKRETISAIKKDTAGLDAKIANFRDTHKKLLSESVRSKKDTVEIDSINEHKERLRNLKQEIKEIENQIEENQKSIKENKQELENSWSLFSGSLEEKQDSLQEEIKQLKDKKQSMQKQVEQVQQTINDSHDLSSLVREFNQSLQPTGEHEDLPELELPIEEGMTVGAVLKLMEEKIGEIQDLSVSETEREQIREYEQLIADEEKARDVYENAAGV